MKAVAVFPKNREVKLIDHSAPIIRKPTEVGLRMLDVGVCGTDKEIVSFQYGTPPENSEYLVMGHESLAEVVEIGKEVADLKVGDLVVLMVRRPCAHKNCFACRSGRQDFCYTGDFKERGIKEIHGFMTEFVVDDEKLMIPVPRELRDVGVLIEPLTIAVKALTQLWQIQARLPWACPVVSGKKSEFCHRALVLGAGPVGLLGAMAMRNAGFQTFVYSHGSDIGIKGLLARSFGATFISAESYSVKSLLELAGPFDVVYEAVGASRLAFEVLETLGTNGVFIFTGVPGRKAPVEIDTDLVMRNLVLKNQVVYGTVNADKAAYEEAVRNLKVFVSKWPGAVHSLITGHYPIERFADLLFEKPGGIKNVIAFDEPKK